MKAIKSAGIISLSNLPYIQFELDRFLLKLGLKKDIDFCYIGSAGKREYSSDLDIAILRNQNLISEFKKYIEDFGYEVKESIGFRQLSFGFPMQDDEIYQVDLMFTDNLDWSTFIYYSPNLLLGESSYKGVYRNLLLMSTMIVLSKNGNDKEFEQDSIRLHEGLVRVKKSYLSLKGNFLKTPRIVTEEFITNDVDKILSRILIFNRLDALTFERLLDKIKITWILEFDSIIEKFKDYCKNCKLEIPWEIRNK